MKVLGDTCAMAARGDLSSHCGWKEHSADRWKEKITRKSTWSSLKSCCPFWSTEQGALCSCPEAGCAVRDPHICFGTRPPVLAAAHVFVWPHKDFSPF